MGRISSSVGLITGIPIQDTVEQLVALQARPRDLLQGITNQIRSEQTAIGDITSRLVSLQVTARRFNQESLYDSRSVSSSDAAALVATKTGTPAQGSFQFTPVRTVQTHQLLSSRLAGDTAPLAAGSFSFAFGGFIDDDAELALLNGGEGIERGKIRITDRSGATAQIDLSLARTVDDVLAAVNSADAINVTAVAQGDAFRLIDNTGGSGNLRVSEVGAGTTAASLGLAGIDVAAGVATGADVVSLFSDFSLALANDGRGVRFDEVLDDLQVTLASGETLTVDFQFAGVAGTHLEGTTGAEAANARIKFTAAQAGAALEGTVIRFKNDDGVTQGEERVFYDEAGGRLTFFIDQGKTTADDVIAALEADDVASELFNATLPDTQFGNGLVEESHNTVLGRPHASATLGVSNSLTGGLRFTAVEGGEDFDDVAISFVYNAGIAKGEETVVYDDTDPQNKTLIFQIAQNQTNINDIVAALNDDPLAGQIFTVKKLPGTNGAALIRDTDTATTSGGELVEPVPAQNELTLGDVLATINAAGAGKLSASIDAGGDRIVLADLTTGTGSLTVDNLNRSRVVEDLGLVSAAAGGQITGERIFSGLKTSLLTSLGGGAGLGPLGQIEITDRGGASDTVDLSAAVTLQDVTEAINAAAVDVVATINAARSGILLTDTSGGGGTLSVAEVGGGDTAAALGLLASTSEDTIDGGSLRLQVVSENTRLASLRGGQGVADGSLTIFDSQGQSANLNLSGADDKSIGDVIEAINKLGLNLTAQINADGDGIALVDTVQYEDLGGLGIIDLTDRSGASDSVDLSTAQSVQDVLDLINAAGLGIIASINGADNGIRITDTTGQTLSNLVVANGADGLFTADRLNVDVNAAVSTLDSGNLHLEELRAALRVEAGSGTTAKDLHLLGGEESSSQGGQTVRQINGSTTIRIDLESGDSLRDLVEQINDLDVGVTAAVFNDGSLTRPFRFTLVSEVAGEVGELRVDSSQAGFSLTESVAARDALLLYGAAGAAGGGILVSSSTNTFEDVLAGVSLEVVQASASPVTVSVATDNSGLVATIIALVDTFNALRNQIEVQTAFDEETNQSAILKGDANVLRVETDLANLFSGRFLGAGSIQSLAAIGIGLTDTGELDFDEAKFGDKIEQSPNAVRDFLSTAEFGLADKIEALIEQLAGVDNSLLINRSLALASKIEINTQKIAFLDERLEATRLRLTNQFVQAELAIGKIQSSLNALASLVPLPPLGSTGNSFTIG